MVRGMPLLHAAQIPTKQECLHSASGRLESRTNACSAATAYEFVAEIEDGATSILTSQGPSD